MLLAQEQPRALETAAPAVDIPHRARRSDRSKRHAIVITIDKIILRSIKYFYKHEFAI